MKFSVNDFFNKCDHIRCKQQMWSHLLKKSLMENFIFCGVGYRGKLQTGRRADGRADRQRLFRRTLRLRGSK